MADHSKVVVYAEMNHGGDISEKELRGIIDMFKKRGFTSAWYERVPSSKFIRAVRFLKDTGSTLKEQWDNIDE